MCDLLFEVTTPRSNILHITLNGVFQIQTKNLNQNFYPYNVFVGNYF